MICLNMRHKEVSKLSGRIEDLEVKEKIALPSLMIQHCNNMIKGNSVIDESTLENSDTDDGDLHVTYEVRKNRRKSLAPQKAVQSTITKNSIGNSSDSSQDLPDPSTSLLVDNLLFLSKRLDKGNVFDLSEDEILPDICNEEDILRELQDDPADDDILSHINEDDIFKDLEEVDGKKLNEDIISNVKQEWQSYKGVKCNMCEQVFLLRAEFDKHYFESYGLQPVYTCTFCNKTAEKYSTFRSHCYRHITEGRYKCEVCSKGFSLQSLLHVHILAKHTKAKPFTCEGCGKSFVTKPGLKIHIKKHQAEIKEDYPCVECGKVLHTRGGLTSHMNVHRLGRRFMCDVCGKTFTQKVNMQQHVKQHTGDKPHTCDKCGKTFAERSHLARHYSFHSDQRPYKCEVCQKMYKTERCLKVHSLVHAAARPFICTYCDKGFLSSTKLKQHYNIHTGERPYKCKYCERTFTNYPNWLKHTRRRHKVDHKTGKELIPELPKEEPPPTPGSLGDTEQMCSGQMLSDISLTKTEEMMLQQSFFNLPLPEDRIVFTQPVDILANANHPSVGLIVPFFQTTLPDPTVMQHPTQPTLQLADIIHTQYLQHTL